LLILIYQTIDTFHIHQCNREKSYVYGQCCVWCSNRNSTKLKKISFYLAVVRDNKHSFDNCKAHVIKTLHNGKFESKFAKLLLRW